MRYGLLNDIRYLDKNKNHLMVEKFAALSMQDSNYCLESLSFPKLSIDFENQQSSLVKFGINQDLPSLAICPGAEFGPRRNGSEDNYSTVAKNISKKVGMFYVSGLQMIMKLERKFLILITYKKKIISII